MDPDVSTLNKISSFTSDAQRQRLDDSSHVHEVELSQSISLLNASQDWLLDDVDSHIMETVATNAK